MLIYKDDPRYILSVIYSTMGFSTYFWIKKNLEQSPYKIKTFRNVLLEYSLTFEKIPDYSFFLLDSVTYIIEHYTDLKYIKHQEKQITLKMNTFMYLISLHNI